MNIQLFLENQEVELNNKIAFPLNKTFENLWNPTDIIVEYSKSINVPATAANNKLMANAYRLDRQYIVGGDTNIGMYLDPMKRIPMKLIYNGTILLDGYAKYTSATRQNGMIYYTFNLYGALGEVFKSLTSVVVSKDQLSDEQKAEPDGGGKYILNDLMYEHPVVGKTLIKQMWENNIEPLVDGNHPSAVIGFAPAYRGLYDDFESNSIVGFETVSISDGTAKSIEDVLKEEWFVNLKNNGYTQEQAEARVDALDFNMLLGEGINEHVIRQFRSYEQKPYVYFCRLMEMYQRKCSEITDYTIELDNRWFNANNPYWTRLCYMLDYLAGRGANIENTTAFSGFSNRPYTQTTTSGGQDIYRTTFTYTDFADIDDMGSITLAPFNVAFSNKQKASDNDLLISGKNNIYDTALILSPKAHVIVNIDFSNVNGTIKTFHFWGAENIDNVTPISTLYNRDNFIQIYNNTSIDSANRMITGEAVLQIPTLSVGAFNTEGLTMTVTASVVYPPTASSQYDFYNAPFIYRYRKPLNGSTVYSKVMLDVNDTDHTVVLPNTEVYSNWRYTTKCNLKNLYSKDTPLFNVILEYTKMFGLIWKVDYATKKIHIMPRQSYFRNYQIVNWDDKFDGSKQCVIEPCSFNARYVDFNYDDIDGYRYKGYSNKYGVAYGGKHIKTKYEFDNKTTELFKGMHPSSASTKSFIYLNDLIEWNTTDKIESSRSEINFIDCENTDQTASIKMNNWYFRGKNHVPTNEYYLSDVSTNEKNAGKYYWISNAYGLFEDDKPVERVNAIPTFDITYNTADGFTRDGRTIGCLFNCPNEDYTADKTTTAAKDNYIYDLFWRDFINERYNSNNKKVTAYFNLSYIDYQQFNFNTFVSFDNQLFVVNKIFDYNPSSNESTKVELVQVKNIDNYIGSTIFPAISVDRTEITGTGDYGSRTIYVRCHPRPDNYEITLDDGAQGSVFIEDVETLGLEVSYTITWEDIPAGATVTGTFTITSGDESISLPLTIRN